MALQLNEPVMQRDRYVDFPLGRVGKNIIEMPKLLADNRYPLPFAESMKLKLRAFDLYASVLENPAQYTPEYRVKVAGFFKDVWSNYADTGDGIFQSPDGKARISLVDPQTARDSEFLKLINPKNKENLREGAIVLPDSVYDSAKGMPEFDKAEMAGLTDKQYSGEGALDNRIWRVLARNPNEVPKELAEDPELLRTFTKAVNYLSALAFDYTQNMGVYTSNPQDVNTARLWYAYRLGDGSDAYGRNRLDDGKGRLVGVAPEAPRLAVPSTERLEEIIAKLKPCEGEVKQLLAA